MRALLAALLLVSLPIMAAVPCGKVCLLLLDGGHDCSYDTAGCAREVDSGPVDAGAATKKTVDAGHRWVDLGTWDPRPNPDEWRTDSYNSTPPEYGAYPLEQHPAEE